MFNVSKFDQLAQRIKAERRKSGVASQVPVNITVSGVSTVAFEPKVKPLKAPN